MLLCVIILPEFELRVAASLGRNSHCRSQWGSMRTRREKGGAETARGLTSRRCQAPTEGSLSGAERGHARDLTMRGSSSNVSVHLQSACPLAVPLGSALDGRKDNW